MKFTQISVIAACCALVAACSGEKKVEGLFAPTDFTLTVNNIEDADSTYAYIYDYDALTGRRNFPAEALIDSALIIDNQACFTVEGSTAPILLLRINGTNYCVLPEAGENTYDATNCEGSGALAKIQKAYNDSLKAVYASANANIPEEEPARTAFIDSVETLLSKMNQDAISANLDNAFGLYQLTNSTEITLAEIDSLVALQPQLAESKRVQTLIGDCKKFEATSAGNPYVDFEIEYNGTTKKLSDYVKPGEYTLVDFWASWCGPCKRAIASLKENYEMLTAKGLNIVGVAVWEDPENTEAWLAENPLPWPIILNGQSIPTDLYAVKGIPTLVLIGPDGNIVARSYSDEEVLEAFENAKAE